jgi:hypothetical protein
MTRNFLALALVATQLVTCASGSLYMCLASDGTVAVDRGPASCGHCQSHKHGENDSCGGKFCQLGEPSHPATRDVSLVLQGGPCNCQHVPMAQAPSSPPRQTTLYLQRLTHDSLVALPTLAAMDLVGHIEQVLRLPPAHDAPPQLRALSSVVLRC